MNLLLWIGWQDLHFSTHNKRSAILERGLPFVNSTLEWPRYRAHLAAAPLPSADQAAPISASLAEIADVFADNPEVVEAGLSEEFRSLSERTADPKDADDVIAAAGSLVSLKQAISDLAANCKDVYIPLAVAGEMLVRTVLKIIEFALPYAELALLQAGFILR